MCVCVCSREVTVSVLPVHSELMSHGQVKVCQAQDLKINVEGDILKGSTYTSSSAHITCNNAQTAEWLMTLMQMYVVKCIVKGT